MDNLEFCKQRARELHVGPLVIEEPQTLSRIVQSLQIHACLSAQEEVPVWTPPGLSIVYANSAGQTEPQVTIALHDSVRLADALDELCRLSGAKISYHPSGIVVWPPPPPGVRELEAEIADLSEKLKAERDGDEYLTPEHLAKMERLQELKLDLRVARMSPDPTAAPSDVPCPPAPSPATLSPARHVQFVGGPADGLDAMLLLPNTTYFEWIEYPGVWYTVPGADDDSAHFSGWIDSK